MLDLFSDIFELIHETGLNCIFYKFNGPLQADFTADTNYILIMFDLWIIHYFEMDLFGESFEPVHKTGLNWIDLFKGTPMQIKIHFNYVPFMNN